MDSGFRFLKGKLQSARVYSEFFPLDPAWRVVNLGAGYGPQAIIYRGQYRLMAGIDVNARRLAASTQAMTHYGVTRYHPVCADVEQTPLVGKAFDAALAVDIIEHVRDPRALCAEAYRLLRPGGCFLVTFPAMHDKFTGAVSRVARLAGRRRKVGAGWNPDAHNQTLPLDEWLALVAGCGFALERSRATTLFPPLHLYGVPRFWFTVGPIHAADRFLCAQPGLKRLGQGLLCLFRKA